MSKINVKTCEQFSNEGKTPEILFWIGCSGSFDDRAKKITKAFIKILNHAKIDFAVLGKDESCTGDPAKRAGNEFLFQMQALSNIKVLNTYNIKTYDSLAGLGQEIAMRAPWDPWGPWRGPKQN